MSISLDTSGAELIELVENVEWVLWVISEFDKAAWDDSYVKWLLKILELNFELKEEVLLAILDFISQKLCKISFLDLFLEDDTEDDFDSPVDQKIVERLVKGCERQNQAQNEATKGILGIFRKRSKSSTTKPLLDPKKVQQMLRLMRKADFSMVANNLTMLKFAHSVLLKYTRSPDSDVVLQSMICCLSIANSAARVANSSFDEILGNILSRAFAVNQKFEDEGEITHSHWVLRFVKYPLEKHIPNNVRHSLILKLQQYRGPVWILLARIVATMAALGDPNCQSAIRGLILDLIGEYDAGQKLSEIKHICIQYTEFIREIYINTADVRILQTTKLDLDRLFLHVLRVTLHPEQIVWLNKRRVISPQSGPHPALMFLKKRKTKEPYPWMCDLFATFAQIQYNDIKPGLALVFRSLSTSLPEHFFDWEEDSKIAVLKCLLSLAFCLEITEIVQRKKISSAEVKTRTLELGLSPDELDTLLQTPLVIIVTTPSESLEVRLAAIDLMGSLGAIDPGQQRRDKKKFKTSSGSYFNGVALLANEDVYVDHQISVKKDFEHSGFLQKDLVKGSWRRYHLPLVPGEPGFEMMAIVKILIEVLYYDNVYHSEGLRNAAVDSLIDVILATKKSLFASRLQIYEVALNNLLSSTNFASPYMERKFIEVLNVLTLTAFEMHPDAHNFSGAIFRVVKKYGMKYMKEVMQLVETYIRIAPFSVDFIISHVKGEICSILEKLQNNIEFKIELQDADGWEMMFRLVRVHFDKLATQQMYLIIVELLVVVLKTYQRGMSQRNESFYNSRDAVAIGCFQVFNDFKHSPVFQHCMLPGTVELINRNITSTLPEHLRKEFQMHHKERPISWFDIQADQGREMVVDYSLRRAAGAAATPVRSPILDIETLINELEKENEALEETSDTIFSLSGDSLRQALSEEEKEFITRMCSLVLAKSADKMLRACSKVAEVSQFVAEELLNVAFASLWNDALGYDNDSRADAMNMHDDDLIGPPLEVQLTEQMFRMVELRPSRNHIILDLVEYFQRGGVMLSFSMEKVGDLAANEGLNAKAIRLYELEYRRVRCEKDIDALVTISKKLEKVYKMQEMSWHADGIDEHLSDILTPERLQEIERDMSSWEENWQDLGAVDVRAISDGATSPRASNANIGSDLRIDSLEKNLDRKVLKVEMKLRSHNPELFTVAKILDLKKATAASFIRQKTKSYKDLYPTVVRTQRLREMTEISDFLSMIKRAKREPEVMQFANNFKVQLHNLFSKRLTNLRQSPFTWFQVLPAHLSLTELSEDRVPWYKLATMFRKEPALSNKIVDLLELLGIPSQLRVESIFKENLGIEPFLTELKSLDPHLAFEYLKFLWGKRKISNLDGGNSQTFKEMQKYVIHGLETVAKKVNPGEFDDPGQGQYALELKVRVLLKIATYMGKITFPSEKIRNKTREKLQKNLFFDGDFLINRQEIMDRWGTSIRRALALDSHNYKSWKAQTDYLIKYRSLHLRSRFDFSNRVSSSKNLLELGALGPEKHMALANQQTAPLLEALFQCVVVGERGSKPILLDVHRFLQVWSELDVSAGVQFGNKYFTTNKIGTCLAPWLTILPQIFARLRRVPRELKPYLQWLLTQLGIKYLDSCIYQLVSRCLNPDENLQPYVQEVMDTLKNFSDRHTNVIREAFDFANEMNRIGIFPAERWHHELNRASKHYFGDFKDIDQMLSILGNLENLYNDQEGRTDVERRFYQIFGKEIEVGLKLLERYRETRIEIHGTEMWDVFTGIFRECGKSMANIKTFRLTRASILMRKKKDFVIPMPGTLIPGMQAADVVTVYRMGEHVQVLGSKQRPRKIELYGSNGKVYTFLLKGYEDLRQDDRLMQLFGLVNDLVGHTKRGKIVDHRIVRFPVIPLTYDVGLVGWVVRAATMHSLVKDYRKKRAIPLNVEFAAFQDFPEYEEQPLNVKLNFFNNVMARRDGLELASALVLSSETSSQWLEKRNRYISSTAVMSMVGYVMGLGDRHPSNILIGHDTGKIIHIDFGDCFEGAMMREAKPELVPVRLTRMIVETLGPQGVEGTFRKTSEHVLKVLRKNKEAILSLLNPFLSDPVLDWWHEFGLVPQKILMKKGLDRPKSGTSPARRTILKTLDHAGKSSSLDKERLKIMPNQSVVHMNKVGLVIFPNSSSKQESSYSMDAMSDDDALFVGTALERVREKLAGLDFDAKAPMNVEEHVEKIIAAATDMDNLCQMYLGWCPFW